MVEKIIEKLLPPVIYIGALILGAIVYPVTRTWVAVGISAARDLIAKHRIEKQLKKEDGNGKESTTR